MADWVTRLVADGTAYPVSTDVGVFVCVSAARLSPRHEPVRYPILHGLLRHEADFPMWAPYVHGNPSPFGPGLQTVNAQLCNHAKNR
jgi:hypothetical protein